MKLRFWHMFILFVALFSEMQCTISVHNTRNKRFIPAGDGVKTKIGKKLSYIFAVKFNTLH